MFPAPTITDPLHSRMSAHSPGVYSLYPIIKRFYLKDTVIFRVAGRLECHVSCFAGLGNDEDFHRLGNLSPCQYGRVEHFPILKGKKKREMVSVLFRIN